MSGPGEQVLGPHPIPGGGQWTAALESVNARTDDAYYEVRRVDAAGVASRFFVIVPLLGRYLTDAEAHSALRRWAEEGTGNTSYAGWR